MIVPRGVSVMVDGEFDPTTGIFEFESDFSDFPDYHVELSDSATGAHVN